MPAHSVLLWFYMHFLRGFLNYLNEFWILGKKKEYKKAKCSQFESTGELTMSRFVKHYSPVIVGFQLQNQE